MSTSPILASPEGDRFIADAARALGLTPSQTKGAVESLLPVLVKGIARNTASRDGLAGLLNALGSGHHQAALQDASTLAKPETLADGQAILGHVLGSRAKADAVAQQAMNDTGVSAGVLQQLLPMLAVFVMGWLYRNSGGILGSVLGSVLGGPSSGSGPSAAPLGRGINLPKMPGGIGQGGSAAGGGPFGRDVGTPAPNRGGGPLSMPDLDRIRRNRGDRPVTDNPFPDLGEIVKGGGGGNAAGSIRDILGGLLGFRTNGWLGWIIRFVVLRYGWQILSFVIRRIFMRG
jgi:hypothetical protein